MAGTLPERGVPWPQREDFLSNMIDLSWEYRDKLDSARFHLCNSSCRLPIAYCNFMVSLIHSAPQLLHLCPHLTDTCIVATSQLHARIMQIAQAAYTTTCQVIQIVDHGYICIKKLLVS